MGSCMDSTALCSAQAVEVQVRAGTYTQKLDVSSARKRQQYFPPETVATFFTPTRNVAKCFVVCKVNRIH